MRQGLGAEPGAGEVPGLPGVQGGLGVHQGRRRRLRAPTRDPRRRRRAPAAPGPRPAWPDRAAWGTATPLRAWQTAAIEQLLRRAAARLPRGRDARAPARRRSRCRVAAELLGRRLVDRVTVVAPTEHLKTQWAEAAARAGIPIDPAYAAGKGKTSQRLRRHRGDLRRRRGQPAGDADPHRAVQDAGDPRRDPPRRRRAVVGRGRARGVRAGAPAAGADRHAVPLRRQPDPVRHLRARRRRRPALGRRLHLRLRRRARRPRRAPGAVHGLLRRDAVAHPRRRRDRRPARRAADQGPDRAGAAHRARPGGLLDAVGAGGGRHPADRRCAATSRTPAGW